MKATVTIKRYGRYINEIANNDESIRRWVLDNVIPAEEDQQGHFGQYSFYSTTPELIHKAQERHYSFE